MKFIDSFSPRKKKIVPEKLKTIDSEFEEPASRSISRNRPDANLSKITVQNS